MSIICKLYQKQHTNTPTTKNSATDRTENIRSHKRDQELIPLLFCTHLMSTKKQWNELQKCLLAEIMSIIRNFIDEFDQIEDEYSAL